MRWSCPFERRCHHCVEGCTFHNTRECRVRAPRTSHFRTKVSELPEQHCNIEFANSFARSFLACIRACHMPFTKVKDGMTDCCAWCVQVRAWPLRNCVRDRRTILLVRSARPALHVRVGCVIDRTNLDNLHSRNNITYYSNISVHAPTCRTAHNCLSSYMAMRRASLLTPPCAQRSTSQRSGCELYSGK
jgi:hypothetical protein